MKLIFALVLLFSSQAFAFTDFACLNDCTQEGYMYGLCHSKCSWDDGASAQAQPRSRIDASIPMGYKAPVFQLPNMQPRQGY